MYSYLYLKREDKVNGNRQISKSGTWYHLTLHLQLLPFFDFLSENQKTLETSARMLEGSFCSF